MHKQLCAGTHTESLPRAEGRRRAREESAREAGGMAAPAPSTGSLGWTQPCCRHRRSGLGATPAALSKLRFHPSTEALLNGSAMPTQEPNHPACPSPLGRVHVGIHCPPMTAVLAERDPYVTLTHTAPTVRLETDTILPSVSHFCGVGRGTAGFFGRPESGI